MTKKKTAAAPAKAPAKVKAAALQATQPARKRERKRPATAAAEALPEGKPRGASADIGMATIICLGALDGLDVNAALGVMALLRRAVDRRAYGPGKDFDPAIYEAATAEMPAGAFAINRSLSEKADI